MVQLDREHIREGGAPHRFKERGFEKEFLGGAALAGLRLGKWGK
jgi:hypothetical protein